MNWLDRIKLAIGSPVVVSPPAAAPSGDKMFTPGDLFLQGKDYLVVNGDGGGNSAYEASWIAYACIRKIAQYGAAVPLMFLSDPDDPESEVPDTHPVRLMFDRPNPYFSRGEFMQWLFTLLNLRGEFFILFDDPARPTQMLQYTDPKYWHDIVDDDGYLVGWEYRAQRNQLALTPDEVLHHRLINPSKPFRGQSPLQAALGPYSIEQGVTELSKDIVRRGGEKALMYSSPLDLTPQQREQALAMLRARRATPNHVGRDVLLPNGVQPVDPKFIEDDMRLLELAAAQPDKVAAAYGVPRSLLGYEDIDKYATFEGRKRMFYVDTMVPLGTGIESAFDSLFIERLGGKYGVYVRFAWDDVPAMQDDLAEKFAAAAAAHNAGLPWTACDERFNLGLDLDLVPGADTVLVSSTLVPIEVLLEEAANPTPAPEVPAPPAEGTGEAGPPVEDDDTDAEAGESDPAAEGTDDNGKAAPLTNELIRKRARDVRSTVARNIRLLRKERAFVKEYRSLLQKYREQMVRAVAHARTQKQVEDALRPVFAKLQPRIVELCAKYHTDGAFEGELSIVELVKGKVSTEDRDMLRKQHKWRPEVAAFMAQRRNRVVGLADDLFKDILAQAQRSVIDGDDIAELQHVIRDRMASAPGGINRATTIARTELATAFSTARFHEMKGQGFQRHTWLTQADELVRSHDEGDAFDHAVCNEETVKVGDEFSCGLVHPCEDGGEAGNVINCRCLTVPYVEEV